MLLPSVVCTKSDESSCVKAEKKRLRKKLLFHSTHPADHCKVALIVGLSVFESYKVRIIIRKLFGPQFQDWKSAVERGFRHC